MKLLDSLLDAIVRLEGDALVMHVGEKPYVVTTSAAMNAYRGPLAWGQVELSSRVLSSEAVQNMLSQILPAEQHRVLAEIGAVEFEIDAPPGVKDRFTVVAARGGDDIWLELRRQPAVIVAPERVVEEQPAMVAGASSGEAAAAALGVQEPSVAPAAREVSPVERPTHVSPADVGAEVREPAEAAGEIEERVPVLDEVSHHEPEHVEHLVISVDGREEHEDVRLDSVPGDAFEVVDDVLQEAPSDSEVDELLAATGAALLTSGLGTDVNLVEDDAQMVALESAALELEEELSAALVEIDRSDQGWSAVGLVAIDSMLIVEPGQPAEDQPPPQVEQSVAESVEAAATAASSPTDVIASTTPPSSQAQAPAEVAGPSPAEQEVADTGGLPLSPPAAVERVPDQESVAAQVEPAAAVPPIAPEAPAVLEPGPEFAPAVPEAEVPQAESVAAEAAKVEAEPAVSAAAPAAAATAERIGIEGAEEKAVEPGVEQTTVAAGVSTEHFAGAAVPETAAAASALPPASIAEPRTPVSETLPELRGGPGAPAPGSYQDLHDSRHGAVVPLGRPPGRAEGVTTAATAILQSALRTAGTRGASTVYLVAQSKPVIRVNGEIVVLESEPVLSAGDVDGLVAVLSPPQRQAGRGEQLEWMSDVPDVGRVRCLTFRDHRGPGVIFRMDHVGLPPEVKALSTQPDGLVVVAGPHASGKSTLVNAFIDQINVTRGDHVITLESRIGFVHESRRSFISQREVGGDPVSAAAAARAALREDPDVLVIEDVGSAELAAVALEAAESGRLVFASITAPSAVMAIEQLLESVPADRRGRAARSLASALRGVVSQVLVRRARGGRVPAREVLLNTPSVSSMIRDGRTGDLSAVFESGRGQGLVSMTDALMALVREGAVQPAEAYRKASDRTALLGRLKQEGVDTTFADRLV